MSFSSAEMAASTSERGSNPFRGDEEEQHAEVIVSPIMVAAPIVNEDENGIERRSAIQPLETEVAPTAIARPSGVGIAVAIAVPSVLQEEERRPTTTLQTEASIRRIRRQRLLRNSSRQSPSNKFLFIRLVPCITLLLALGVILAVIYGVLSKPRLVVTSLNLDSLDTTIKVRLHNRNDYQATWKHMKLDLLFKSTSSDYHLASFEHKAAINVAATSSTTFTLDRLTYLSTFVANLVRQECSAYGSVQLKLQGKLRGKMKNGAASTRQRHLLSSWKNIPCQQ